MARQLISFDWALKKLLRSKANFGILEGFLSELINEDIKILEILESESNKETKLDKFNRVDLKAKNSKGEIIIIEVQYEREWYYYQRILYSTSKAITEHIDQGQDYENVTKVISVNILYFEIGHGQDYVYHGTTNFIGIHTNDELQLTPQQKETLTKEKIYQVFPEYYLLKINNFNDKAKNTLDEWIYFLKNQKIKNNFKAKGLKEAKTKFDLMLLPEDKRKEYEKFIETRRQFKSQFLTARMEGKTEGRDERSVEIAMNMLSMDIDINKITKATGLSISDIKKLQIDSNKVSERPKKYSAKTRKKAKKR